MDIKTGENHSPGPELNRSNAALAMFRRSRFNMFFDLVSPRHQSKRVSTGIC